MKPISCACGDCSCKNKIYFDSIGGTMLVTKASENIDILFYLDPNTVVDLIKNLNTFLIEQTGYTPLEKYP